MGDMEVAGTFRYFYQFYNFFDEFFLRIRSGFCDNLFWRILLIFEQFFYQLRKQF